MEKIYKPVILKNSLRKKYFLKNREIRLIDPYLLKRIWMRKVLWIFRLLLDWFATSRSRLTAAKFRNMEEEEIEEDEKEEEDTDFT